MHQVDLESLVSVCGGGGSDRKITCETLADDTEFDNPENDDDVENVAEAEVPPDFPPESFWLSKDSEFDWFDRHAFFERKESTKGANSNSNSTNLNPSVNPSSNSNSQRFSLKVKSKAAIIGLPKTQKNTHVDSKRRNCKATAKVRLFPPKRTESVGKSNTPANEPSSPKVSCMGRVRSKRGRRKSTDPARKREKTIDRSSSSREKKKTGFYSRVFSMFRSGGDRKKPVKLAVNFVEESTVEERISTRKSVDLKFHERKVRVEPVAAAEPPGLGGVKRFASGRRSESWSAEEIQVSLS